MQVRGEDCNPGALLPSCPSTQQALSRTLVGDVVMALVARRVCAPTSVSGFSWWVKPGPTTESPWECGVNPGFTFILYYVFLVSGSVRGEISYGWGIIYAGRV